MKILQSKQITADTALPNRKIRKLSKNLLMTMLWPTICLLIAIFLATISNPEDPLFATSVSYHSFFRGALMVFIAMWALNLNLNSGRIDFSLGATGILASLISLNLMNGSIATTQELIQYMLLTMGLAMVIGLVSGLVYIALKLPPVVTSLGLCIVYEGIAKIIAGDNNTVSFTNTSSLTGKFALDPVNIAIILVAVLVGVSLLIDYSKFGYEKNALVWDQKIAVDTGIKEIVNCIVCFLVAGLLIGLYQFLDSTQLSHVSVKVDLASSSTMFQNFLPIFIGGLLAKYSNQLIGSLSAAFGTQLLILGMEKANVIGVSASVQSLITGFMVFGVLVYMVDKDAFIGWIKMKQYLFKQRRLGFNIDKKGDEI